MVSTTDALGLTEKSCWLRWDEWEGNTVVSKVTQTLKPPGVWKRAEGKNAGVG